MFGSVAALLGAWQNFYVIIGSAAAALTGLMFVAVTLIVARTNRLSEYATNAYATPTIVHLSSTLLIAATLSAPWPALWHVSAMLILYGGVGLAYMCLICRRFFQQRGYTPVMEDWLWHVILPMACYGALLLAAGFLPRVGPGMLFAIGAATLLFLLISVHNSWDLITFISFTPPEEIVEQVKQASKK